MRIINLALAMALLIGLVGPLDGWAAQKAKTAAKAPVKKKAATAKTVTRKKVPVRKRTVRRTVARRATAPVNQRVPTKDRYAEIQQALVDAGYFTGEADGVWNDASVEALKSFQDASGFEPTGKIDARSLIKLGLGPNYEASATGAPPVQGASPPQGSQPIDMRKPG